MYICVYTYVYIHICISVHLSMYICLFSIRAIHKKKKRCPRRAYSHKRQQNLFISTGTSRLPLVPSARILSQRASNVNPFSISPRDFCPHSSYNSNPLYSPLAPHPTSYPPSQAPAGGHNGAHRPKRHGPAPSIISPPSLQTTLPRHPTSYPYVFYRVSRIPEAQP